MLWSLTTLAVVHVLHIGVILLGLLERSLQAEDIGFELRSATF